jgi:hypothetical protein
MGCPAPHAAARHRPRAPSLTVAGPQKLGIQYARLALDFTRCFSQGEQPGILSICHSLCSVLREWFRRRVVGDDGRIEDASLTHATKPSFGTGSVAGAGTMPFLPRTRRSQAGEVAPFILQSVPRNRGQAAFRCWVVTPGSINRCCHEGEILRSRRTPRGRRELDPAMTLVPSDNGGH